MSIAPGYGERDDGGYVVRRPLVTDAIGGALLRTFGHAPTIPEDMRRCLDRLDRPTR